MCLCWRPTISGSLGSTGICPLTVNAVDGVVKNLTLIKVQNNIASTGKAIVVAHVVGLVLNVLIVMAGISTTSGAQGTRLLSRVIHEMRLSPLVAILWQCHRGRSRGVS